MALMFQYEQQAPLNLRANELAAGNRQGAAAQHGIAVAARRREERPTDGSAAGWHTDPGMSASGTD
jgi:hypothetical protein